MKKFFKSILVVFSLVTLVSCNEDDSKFSVDPQSGWAQFKTADEINVSFGTTDEVVIPVKLFTSVNSGVDVMYTIENVVGLSSDVLTQRWQLAYQLLAVSSCQIPANHGNFFISQNVPAHHNSHQ